MQGVILKKADDNIICSIQIQVVILKRGVIQFGKFLFSVLSPFFRRFHYVHLTTCFRSEEIVYKKDFHIFDSLSLFFLRVPCPISHPVFI